jgi:hypothetical protein
VLRQQGKSDVMTYFGLSARSAVYYQAGLPLHGSNLGVDNTCFVFVKPFYLLFECDILATDVVGYFSINLQPGCGPALLLFH